MCDVSSHSNCYADLMFVISYPRLANNSDSWQFLFPETPVNCLPVTFRLAPCRCLLLLSQKWLSVFVLCGASVFVKEMRVHDLAIPPVTSNLTAWLGQGHLLKHDTRRLIITLVKVM